MDEVYVLGNGLSRKNVNPYQLKGTIIGCNACYRDFEPDIICAIDAGIIFDIIESGYNGDCYFTHNSWNPLPAKMRNQLMFGDDAVIYETSRTADSEKFVVISGFDKKIDKKLNYIIWEPPHPHIKNICNSNTFWDTDKEAYQLIGETDKVVNGWSTGTSAVYIACNELNPKKVYLLGFDHQSNKYDNIYANTSHYYKTTSDQNWGNAHRDWTKQLIKLFKWYPNIDFYWVNSSLKWPNQDNLHFIERV